MDRLHEALVGYLRATSPTRGAQTDQLGEGPPEQADEDTALSARLVLDQRLQEAYASNGRVFALIQGLFVLLCLTGVALMFWHSWGDRGSFGVVFGETGVLAGLVGIVVKMLDTHRKKVAMDILVTILPSLSQADLRAVARGIIETLFG